MPPGGQADLEGAAEVRRPRGGVTPQQRGGGGLEAHPGGVLEEGVKEERRELL